MDPIGLAFGLISTTAALAFRVNQLITELEIASNEFEDIIYQFIITRTALNRLKDLFQNSSIPPDVTSDYMSQVKEHQNILDGIETRLKKARKNLNSESFFSRFTQKQDLMDGDLRRLTNQILAFNTSLNLMATTYTCVIGSLIHSSVSRIEAGISRVESGVKRVETRTQAIEKIRMDINIQYIKAAIQTQEEDGHMDGGSTPMGPPRYEDVQSEESTDTSMDDVEWDFDLSLLPGFLSTTIKAKNERAQDKPAITGTSISGYPHDSKKHNFELKTQVDKTPQVQVLRTYKSLRVGRHHSDPKPRQESL